MHIKNKRIKAVLWSVAAYGCAATVAVAQSPGQMDPSSLVGNGGSTKDQQRIQQSHIKSVAIWRYAGTTQGVEAKGAQVATFTYDKVGHVTMQSAAGAAGGSNVVERQYNAQGKVVESLTGRPGAQSKVDFKYDAAGKMQAAAGYGPDGAQTMGMQYQYDAQGRIARVTMADKVRGNTEWTREYGSDGNPSRLTMVAHLAKGVTSQTIVQLTGPEAKYDQTTSDAKGKVLVHLQSTIDSKGNPLDLVETDASGLVIGKAHSGFDGQGNLIRRTLFDAAGKTILDTTNTFDGHGNLTETVTQTPAGKTRTVSHYDANGNKLDETEYDKQDRPVEVFKYVYEYYGN